MYNLTEYCNNYSDTTGSLWQFKRDESLTNNGNPVSVATNNSSTFEYKSRILGKAIIVVGNDRVLENIKILVPLKYLINFCKIYLERNWTKIV